MKQLKYFAATALLSLAACGDEPQPNPQAQQAQGNYAVQVAIPEEGIALKEADVELINAVKSDNIRRVKAVLDNKGASVSATDEKLQTALMMAAAKKDPEMLKAMLEYVKAGDSVTLDRGDPQGKSAIIHATEYGAAENITALRKKGANPNVFDFDLRFPLLIAVTINDTAKVNALLENISGTVPANPKLQNADGDNAILAATQTGNQPLIKLLKDYGADINVSTTLSVTPLFFAISKNDTALFDYLLTQGSDINDLSTGRTPLIYALETQNFTFAQHILSKGADVNKHKPELASPLQVLVSQESASKELTAAMLAAGAKVSEGTQPSLLLSRSIRKGNAPVVQMLIEKGLKVSELETQNSNGLLEALKADEPEIALLMINKGADVNKADEDGFSALATAAKMGYTAVVEALIKAGADVNQASRNKSAIPLEIVIESDNPEMLQIMFLNGLKASPDAILLRAVAGKNSKIVPVVLKQGAKPNIMDTAGRPALWLAVGQDDTETAKALVEAGALLDVQDNEKSLSPLSFAIARANMELANYFVQKGANPDLIDRNGFTSLTYAVIAGQSDMAKLLISKGAQAKALDKNNRTLLQILAEAKINPQKKQEIEGILTAAGAQ